MYVDVVKEHSLITKGTTLYSFPNNYGLLNYISFNRREEEFAYLSKLFLFLL